MRAIALAAYGKPSEYDIATLPTPQITKDDEVLIKVHAASIYPVDVKFASGAAKMMKKDTYVLHSLVSPSTASVELSEQALD
jgi:NADPH:quinone reductase-like Zn-dependent oxidoreductase